MISQLRSVTLEIFPLGLPAIGRLVECIRKQRDMIAFLQTY